MNRKWMTSITLVLLLLLAAPARADGPFDFQQASKLKRARDMRNGGIALIATGASALAAGVLLEGLWMLAFADFHRHYPDYYPAFFPTGLALCGSGAVVAAGGGVPLLVVGRRREKKLLRGISISTNGATTVTQMHYQLNEPCRDDCIRSKPQPDPSTFLLFECTCG